MIDRGEKSRHIQDSGGLGSGTEIIIIHNKRRSHVHLTEQTGSNNALQIEARASLRDSSHPMPKHILCAYQSEDTDTVSRILQQSVLLAPNATYVPHRYDRMYCKAEFIPTPPHAGKLTILQ